jgi:hypothetical protein
MLSLLFCHKAKIFELMGRIRDAILQIQYAIEISKDNINRINYRNYFLSLPDHVSIDSN